jgi:hypothetical protein
MPAARRNASRGTRRFSAGPSNGTRSGAGRSWAAHDSSPVFPTPLMFLEQPAGSEPRPCAAPSNGHPPTCLPTKLAEEPHRRLSLWLSRQTGGRTPCQGRRIRRWPTCQAPRTGAARTTRLVAAEPFVIASVIASAIGLSTRRRLWQNVARETNTCYENGLLAVSGPTIPGRTKRTLQSCAIEACKRPPCRSHDSGSARSPQNLPCKLQTLGAWVRSDVAS